MKLQVTYVSEDHDTYPIVNGGTDNLTWDLTRDMQSILLGFGNGIFLEMRVIGDSEEALKRFRAIMKAGGYDETTPKSQAWLYQSGDECYGGFVFIDPKPQATLF